MPNFLFTDIEGSTEKWEKHRAEMESALSRHDLILRNSIAAHRGKIISHTGDGIFAVFEKGDPLSCALEIQKNFAREDWGILGDLRVRAAIHAGDAENRDGNYFGPAVNRAARILSAGWGGQIVVSSQAVEACPLPEKAVLQDLGNHLLKDLAEPQHLFGLLHPDLPLKQFPPLRSLSSTPNNLPAQPTPFVGREESLLKIESLLRNNTARLVTLCGPGGIGKTRLALQAAAENIEAFPDGAYLAALAPVDSPTAVVPAVAAALQFSFYGGQDNKTQLIGYLKRKKLLLILDNFEHVIEGASLAAEILRSAPDVKILATSRERLNVQGEIIFDVGELGEDSSIQLFIQGAQRVKADFHCTREERAQVIRICRAVGEMPLGIELASAWVRVLSCPEIADEINKNMEFLSSSLRDVPERHRSLKATFDYSWNLLSDKEREVFRGISVFRGGFTRDAAQQAAGASLHVLSGLVDKSLIKRTQSGRYEIHELLREFARKKLEEDRDELEKILDLHAAYYCDLLRNKEQDLGGKEQPKALREIDAEIENVRAAWSRCAEELSLANLEKGLQSFSQYLQFRGLYAEAQEYFGRARDLLAAGAGSAESLGLLGRIMVRESSICANARMGPKALDLAEKSLRIARETRNNLETAHSLRALGNAAGFLGQLDEARKHYEDAVAIYRELGDRLNEAKTMSNLGDLLWYIGEQNDGTLISRESLAIFRQLGDRRATMISATNLGIGLRYAGSYPEALELLEEGLDIARELGDPLGISQGVIAMADLALAQEKYDDAKILFNEAAEIARNLNIQEGLASACHGLAEIAYRNGQYEDSGRLFKESLRMFRDISYPIGVVETSEGLGKVMLTLGKREEAEEIFLGAMKLAVELRLVVHVHEIFVEMFPLLLESANVPYSRELVSILREIGEEKGKYGEKARLLFAGLAPDLQKELPRPSEESNATTRLMSIARKIVEGIKSA